MHSEIDENQPRAASPGYPAVLMGLLFWFALEANNNQMNRTAFFIIPFARCGGVSKGRSCAAWYLRGPLQ